jgi:hypothetical protein
MSITPTALGLDTVAWSICAVRASGTTLAGNQGVPLHAFQGAAIVTSVDVYVESVGGAATTLLWNVDLSGEGIIFAGDDSFALGIGGHSWRGALPLSPNVPKVAWNVQSLVTSYISVVIAGYYVGVFPDQVFLIS